MSVRKNNLVNQRRGTGGPAKVPERDIAAMRFFRETHGMSIANIALYFEGAYTDRYIRSVCDYVVRTNIKPRDPDAAT